ncbi:MAG: hypothetical protein JWM85_804 [Acidimicrobiaceae bacterium]|nr:hypothetical protein [Acidimicrobiaceae bacterium]
MADHVAVVTDHSNVEVGHEDEEVLASVRATDPDLMEPDR